MFNDIAGDAQKTQGFRERLAHSWHKGPGRSAPQAGVRFAAEGSGGVGMARAWVRAGPEARRWRPRRSECDPLRHSGSPAEFVLRGLMPVAGGSRADWHDSCTTVSERAGRD